MPQKELTFAAVGDIMLDHEVSKVVERKGPDFPCARACPNIHKLFTYTKIDKNVESMHADALMHGKCSKELMTSHARI